MSDTSRTDDLPELTLPPEILAMMASFEAAASDEAETAQESDPEAEDKAETLPLLEAPPVAAVGEAASGDEAVLVLAPVLDITAAAPLHAALLAHRGTPLRVEAGEVKRLGGQCLQLLLSAGRTYAADRVPIRLQGASDAFRRDLALFGIADPFQLDAA
ncbi:STAS domain-containing protein [Aureimonas sp. AU4]|uniref:STAS domain-containing protein n=1 Tax=Aureimonas sp. AU4 TaxID=1638163 RepID=UPI000A5BC340|nr:STAS domain-containing protein [Aureimonas sp. AU4]